MFVVFGFEGFFYVFGEVFIFGFVVGVVKEDVGLGIFVVIVYMNEDGVVVFIFFVVFMIKGIDFVVMLLKVLYLV